MNISFPTHNRPARPALHFLLVFAGLYALWVLGYDGLLGPNNRLDHALSANLAATSAATLRLAGWAAHIDLNEPKLLVLNDQPSVIVGDPCNGLLLYALFAGFIIAFPGPIRHKLWFVPLGMLTIYALNVGRVAVLALNHVYWHPTVEFNHHYTFTFVVYGAIGALWIIWARHIANPTVLAPVHVPH